jgi:hypothetical protein
VIDKIDEPVIPILRTVQADIVALKTDMVVVETDTAAQREGVRTSTSG